MSASAEDFSDPGYLRHCVRPDCGASFNIGEAYSGINREQADGWRILRRVADGYICPVHAPAVLSGAHVPGWLDLDAPPGMQGVLCACGWNWVPAMPATAGMHAEQWLAHLTAADPGQAVA